jgi:sulfate permease, SulP family
MLAVISTSFHGFVSTLPGTIIFGTIAFAPLGSDFIPFGIFYCFLGHFIIGGLSGLFSSSKEMIVGPRSYVAVVYAAVISATVLSFEETHSPSEITAIAVLCASITGILSGLFQTVFGFLNFGKVVKFIPYDVISCLVNSTALLILIAQLNPILGFGYETSIPVLFSSAAHFNYVSLLLAGVTMVTFKLIPDNMTFLPSSLISCIVGIGSYQLIKAFNFSATNVPTFPSINLNSMDLVFWTDINFISVNPSLTPMILSILISAVLLASLNTIHLLFVGKQIQRIRGGKLETKNDLIANGTSNVISSMLGGLPGSGKLGASTIILKAGQRGNLTPLVIALCYLLAMIFIFPWMNVVPTAVIAGLSIILCFRLFDENAKDLGRFLIKGKFKKIATNTNGSLVILLAMFLSITMGVLAGIVAAFLAVLFEIFLKTADFKSQAFPIGSRRSRIDRSQNEKRVLDDANHGIQVVQIEGRILFYSAEQVVKDLIIATSECSGVIIFDLNKCRYVDTTGWEIVSKFIEEISQKCNTVILMGLNEPLSNKFKSIYKNGEKDNISISSEYELEQVLETAENKILEEKNIFRKKISKFEDSDLVFGMSDEQINLVKHHTVKRILKAGERLDGSHDELGMISIIKVGLVDIFENSDPSINGEKNKRLFSYKPGSIIGEVSFIDGGSRSAEVKCRQDTELWCLSRHNFDQIAKDDPEIALKLWNNLAWVLASRLRSTNSIVGELKTSV